MDYDWIHIWDIHISLQKCGFKCKFFFLNSVYFSSSIPILFISTIQDSKNNKSNEHSVLKRKLILKLISIVLVRAKKKNKRDFEIFI